MFYRGRFTPFLEFCSLKSPFISSQHFLKIIWSLRILISAVNDPFTLLYAVWFDNFKDENMYKYHFGDGFYEKHFYFLAICDFRAEGFLLPVGALERRRYFIRPGPFIFYRL